MKYIDKEFSFFILIFLPVAIILMTLITYNNFIYRQQTAILNNVYSTTGNTLNLNPSQSTENQEETYRKLVSEMLPANIELQYNESIFFGKLVSYMYREGYSFGELKEEQRKFEIYNLSKYIPNNIITITNGSELKFRIIGYPERIGEPLSLSINSYEINEDHDKKLQNPKVLNIADNQNELIFIVNLLPGKYMLVATATWIPETTDSISGYVMYAYNIHIKK